MIQLNPPLTRVVVGGVGWIGPTGKGVANLIEPGHRDDDIIWIIDLDSSGETWCVPNRFVRAPKNVTYGRTLVTHLDERNDTQPINGASGKAQRPVRG